MAYDEELAERVRAMVATAADGEVTERKMFGGLAVMVGGNMACGVVGERLMLRLGKEGVQAALTEPHTSPMDFTGKPLTSMVYVDEEGITDDADLERWVERAVGFADSLPPKPPKQ